jgi:hypothetical protein
MSRLPLFFCFIFGAVALSFHSYGQFSYQYLEVLYDSAWTYKNLQLIPVRFKAGRGEGKGKYLSLQDAMLQKKVLIRELPAKIGSDKGSVSITNRSRSTIIVKSGDMIGGGKQDRIMRETTLIPPGQKKEIMTVFCIEKDRWDDKARPFFYGGSGDLELRKAIDISRRQAAVWKEIDRQYTLQNTTSKTWSYLQLFSDTARNKSYAQYFKKKYAESNGGFAGFLFITGNQLMGVELFSKPDYTDASFDAMLASYINSLEDGDHPPLVSPGRQRSFMDNVLASKDNQNRLIRKQGAAHKYEGSVIHIVVYGSGF